MVTQGKWLVSSGVLVCDEKARIIANCMPLGMPEFDIPVEEAIDNARLIAAAPALLKVCKELADIFPENNISEMDAADFIDRANRIWTAAQSTKNVLAQAGK